MSEHADVAVQVRGYLAVFGALLVLTVADGGRVVSGPADRRRPSRWASPSRRSRRRSSRCSSCTCKARARDGLLAALALTAVLFVGALRVHAVDRRRSPARARSSTTPFSVPDGARGRTGRKEPTDGCPVCFGGDDPVVRESLNAGIGVLLGVTVVVLGLLRALLRAAGPALARGGAPGHRTEIGLGASRSDARAIERADARVARPARRGVGARRRGGPDHGARPLADARAVRRLGRLLRLRAVPLPAAARSRAPTIAACAGAGRHVGRRRRARRRDRPARVLLDPVLEHQRRRAAADESQATVVRVVAEQFAWNVHYPGADGMFGRTDITLVNPDNPLGLDRRDAGGEGRHHDDQPAEPAGRQARASSSCRART